MTESQVRARQILMKIIMSPNIIALRTTDDLVDASWATANKFMDRYDQHLAYAVGDDLDP